MGGRADRSGEWANGRRACLRPGELVACGQSGQARAYELEGRQTDGVGTRASGRLGGRSEGGRREGGGRHRSATESNRRSQTSLERDQANEEGFFGDGWRTSACPEDWMVVWWSGSQGCGFKSWRTGGRVRGFGRERILIVGWVGWFPGAQWVW